MKCNTSSEQYKRGMKLQNAVQQEFGEEFQEVIRVREDWLPSIDPYLRESQLSLLEKTWGDLVVRLTPKGEAIFVECVSLKDERSRFPESKVGMFEGDNKWYAFAWDGKLQKIIPSRTWNGYARKLESFSFRGSPYRKFTKWHIRNIRMGCTSVLEFKALLESCNESR